MAIQTTKFAAIQTNDGTERGYLLGVFGVGSTANDATNDAQQWSDDTDGLVLVRATDAAVEFVATFGADGARGLDLIYAPARVLVTVAERESAQ